MKYILIILLLLVYYSTKGQTLTVYERNTGEPMDLVTIISQSPQAIATTNAAGKADISEFVGAESIQIHMYGYETIRLSYDSLQSLGFRVRLSMDDFNMDEVVVSATRWRQFAQDIPSKITSISPKEVALQNPQTAADLLGISGQVYIQKSQQGGGSPMIRGFATNRLLYIVDGVRMNNAIFRGGNIQNVINLDPFAIDDTEVLFGPGSVIYGSDAIGGVMSFETLQPKFSINDTLYIAGTAQARYSSANKENTAHVDLNIGWKKWALVTSLSSWSYDHLRQGKNGPDDYLKPYYVSRIDSTDRVLYQDDNLLQIPTAYDQINLMQKIRYRPSKNWDISYGFHYSETSPYGRYDRHNRTRNNLPRYALWNYGPQKWMMNNLSLMHTSNQFLYDNLSVKVAMQSFEESRISRNFNDPELSENLEQVYTYSANIDLSKKLGKAHTLYYGGEYVLNDVNSSGTLTDINSSSVIGINSRYPQASWQSIGIYINDEVKLKEKFTFQLGARYNRFLIDASFDTPYFPLPFKKANVDEDALSGSIGAVYRPSKKWIIKTSLGTAFRAPNVDDIGKIFDSEPGAVTVPNPNLSAEYAYNIDLGITKVFGSFLKTELTAYYTYLDNAIVRRAFTLNGQDSIQYEGVNSQVQALQNAAVARVWGLQASFELKLPLGISWATDLNYQKGEEELEDGGISPSRHAAPFFGVSRLNLKAERLQIQAYINFQGERDFEDLAIEERNKDEIYAKNEDGNNYAPAWYTLNLKMQYSLNSKFSITSGIENITDQRYRPYSSGLSGAGRNFFISAKVNF